jgi:mRNA-degrading endonuclease toxin of MazEF toxin-antitoxin module
MDCLRNQQRRRDPGRCFGYKVDRVYPLQVLLAPAATGLAVDSKAQAEQVRSVDIGRVRERVA